MAVGKWQRWCEPDQLERIVNWSANGCTYAEIARNVGIAEGTLYRWVNEHPEICEAIKRGRSLACEAVENALFRLAVGGIEVTETVEEERAGVTVSRKVVTKTLPPNNAAAIFYLKNRMPDRYSDRRVMEVENAAPTIALGVEPRRADG